jgi:hypothetical protein
MRSWSVALAALTLGLGGCGGDTGTLPPPESPGNITFAWSFPNGQTCAQVADKVSLVHISLTGPNGPEVLDPQALGWFSCTVAGKDGITLGQVASDPSSVPFDAGSYTYTVEAWDSARSQKYYSTTGTLRVSGNVTVSVTLNSTVTTGRMQAFWKFYVDGQEKTCAAAAIAADGVGVTKVRVTINDEPPQEQACANADTAGNPVQGWGWDRTPGTYQVTLDGIIVRAFVDPATGQSTTQEQVWFSDTEPVTVAAGQTADVTFTMLPVAAGAHFVPKLHDKDGNAFTSCAAAGVEAFNVKLTDYDTPPDSTTPFTSAKCEDVLAHGFFWDFLSTSQSYDKASKTWQGNWTVTLEAWDSAQAAHTVKEHATAQVLLSAGYADQAVPIDLSP